MQVAVDRPDASQAEVRPFRHDVTRAKGIAIVLVVLGHLVTGTPPASNDWYGVLRTAVYAFHMPFFLYLSGYVFYYSDTPTKARLALGRFAAIRFERLLVPFLLFGVLILGGKYLAATFIHVDNYSGSFATDLANIVWHTRHSSVQSIWYLFVLFELSVLTVLVSFVVATPRFLLVASLCVVWLYPYGSILYVDRLLLYAPFFYLGGVCAVAGQRWLSFVDRFLPLAVIAFVAAIIATRFAHVYLLSILVCGTLSIPVLHGIARTEASGRLSIIAYLGGFSFVIYLLNTVFIGATKGILFTVVRWDGAWFLLYVPVLLIAGLAGPIVLKTYVLKHSKFLDHITT